LKSKGKKKKTGGGNKEGRRKKTKGSTALGGFFYTGEKKWGGNVNKKIKTHLKKDKKRISFTGERKKD